MLAAYEEVLAKTRRRRLIKKVNFDFAMLYELSFGNEHPTHEQLSLAISRRKRFGFYFLLI
jgi:hypothetical protein